MLSIRRNSLLRSTGLRLAVVFGTLFLGAFVVAGFTVYELMRWETYQRDDDAIAETYAALSSLYGEDEDDLLDGVRTNARATLNNHRAFLLTAPDGSVLAGNIPAVHLPDGWSTVSGRVLRLNSDASYRLLAGPVGPDRLVVGQSYEDINALELIAMDSFGWTSLVVVVMALAGGLFIALQAQRRLRAVSEAMDGISHGQLAVRIPLLGNGDDIDLLCQNINTALERLQTTVEGMRQVSNDIAHDLKTPLNRLRISIEEVRRRQEEGGFPADGLESVAEEADHLNEMFEALLRIAQIEGGARKAGFGPVDVSDLQDAVADMYEAPVEDAGSVLISRRPEQSAWIWGDRDLLVHMISNLVENAIRHCPPGRIIELDLRVDGGTVVLCVQDDGPGIPRTERDLVLRRFYRLDRSRTSPGTGLGLSLVKAVAELHEAELRLEDANPGLRVELRFPGQPAKPALLGAVSRQAASSLSAELI